MMDKNELAKTISDGALQAVGSAAADFVMMRLKMLWRGGFALVARNDPFMPVATVMELPPLQVTTPSKRVEWALADAREVDADNVLLRRFDRMLARIDTDEDIATLFAITSVVVWVFGDASAVTVEAQSGAAIVTAVQKTYRNGPTTARTNTAARVLSLLSDDIAQPGDRSAPLVFHVDDLRAMNTILRTADAPEPTVHDRFVPPRR